MAEFRSDLEDFQEFGKIYRLSRDCIITEKIDGTNAQVVVLEDGRVLAGSRNRWITPEADNFGFARWVKEHEEELRSLGPGRHYGEWWGSGIQRGYGLKEKRFSLFNVSRWSEGFEGGTAPACCHVVPVLYKGLFNTEKIEFSLAGLATGGSWAAPGFMKPEGIVIFHVPSGHLYKKTIEKDEEPKGMSHAKV